jgi:hypothetical protein
MKKRYYLLGAFAILLASLLFFLSSIVKNWAVKNSDELLGRKMAISDLHFNYLKVAVRATEVAIYETNDVDSFISFRELYVDFSPWKLLNKEYSFSKISLDGLYANIVQNDTLFNFGDLVPTDDSTAVVEQEQDGTGIKFSIYNFSLTNGNVRYLDEQINNQLDIKNLNLELPLIAWNQNQSDVGAKFNIGEHGLVEVNAVVDNQQNNYLINLKTKDVSLQPITGYLKDYADLESLDGLLTSDIQITGNMEEVIDLTISGKGAIRDLSAKDGSSHEFITANEVRTTIKEISLKNFRFDFASAELDQPHLVLARDKEMTNLERVLLPYFMADSIAAAQIVLSEGPATEEPALTYAVDTIQINQGKVSFADNSLNRSFHLNVSDLNMTMFGFSESSDHIPVAFSAKLNDGSIQGKTVWSMMEPFNFEFDGQLKRLNLVNFSPYSEFYIASPVTQGWFNYDIQIKMTPKSLTNKNVIKVEELEFGKKTADETKLKVPLKLGLYIMKDPKDNISIDMPVSGSTADPQFKLGKIIWKAFANLMAKTALSPFKALAGLTGTDPEKLEYVHFTLAQDSLGQEQKSTLASLTTILSKKPDLDVIMSQRTDEEAEKAQLAIKLAKMDYLSANQQTPVLPENNDTAFLSFIRQQVPEIDSIGVEQSCLQFIAPNRVDDQFRELLERRNQFVREFFIEQGLPEESVHILTSDLKMLPLELRKPEYKVEVSMK